MFKKFLVTVAAIAAISINLSTPVNAAENDTVKVGDVIEVSQIEELKPGKYDLEAELSCYVSAMGGVEFGKTLLTDASLEIKKDKTANITLTFGTSSVTIYTITCYTYIGEAYYLSGARVEGNIGYYDGREWKNDATYTLSKNTVKPSYSSIDGYNMVNYIETMTFPVTDITDKYKLGLVVDSSVMGMQFGGADDAKYEATLSVDWSRAEVTELYKIEDETPVIDEEKKDNDKESEEILKNSVVEGMNEKLNIKEVKETADDYVAAVSILGSKVKFAAVDISFESGKQPVAGTRISIPVMKAIRDAEFVRVSVINNGVLEEVAVVKISDGMITFEPKHFSTYVFSQATEAEYKAANETEPKENNDNKNNTDEIQAAPKTDDNRSCGKVLLMALVAAGIVVVGSKKENQYRK